MRPTNTKENDIAGNSIRKTDSENEGNFTLPDSLSNASQRGLLDGSVMWAEPKTLGLGTRSGGPEESPNARTVTKGVAAGQTRPVGAVLVVGEPKRQAMPVANNGTSSKQSVIDEKHENEADPWTKWRRKYATEVYVPKPLASVFRDEAATLGRDEAFAIVKAARSILNEELQARQSRRDTPASQQTLADYAKNVPANRHGSRGRGCGRSEATASSVEPVRSTKANVFGCEDRPKMAWTGAATCFVASTRFTSA